MRLIRPKQYFFETLLTQPFPKNRTIFNLLSHFHRWRAKSSEAVSSLFKTYNPSLLFVTYPTAMDEFEFMKYAKDVGIPLVGLIHSWDVLTTEGQVVVPLDHCLVWNDVMRTELNVIHGVPNGGSR